jgi:hypothetical protein
MRTRAARLRVLGVLVLGVHGVVLAFAQWLLYRQFLSRTLLDLVEPLRAAFVTYTLRIAAAELAMFAAAAGAIAITGAIDRRGGARKVGPDLQARFVAAVGLLAYAVVALYGVAIVAAVAFGWEPDVFVMSTADATDVEVVAALREALPLVLQPLLWGRLVTTIAASVAFWILQMHLCAVSRGRAAITAAAAALAAVAAQVLVLGVPDLSLMTLSPWLLGALGLSDITPLDLPAI